MKSYIIHLIRHGVTLGNLEGRYIGSTDLPLCQEGIDEITQLKQEFDYPQVEAVFSSPLKRCVETAKIIYPEKQCITLDGFAENDFGEWENKTAEELKGNKDYEKWATSLEEITPPGGESAVDFQIRTCKAFEKVVEGMMKSGVTSAAIVAHGGTIMSILSVYGLPRANFYEWMTPNGRGYSLRLTPSLWMRDKVIEVFDTLPDTLEIRNACVRADGYDFDAGMDDFDGLDEYLRECENEYDDDEYDEHDHCCDEHDCDCGHEH